MNDKKIPLELSENSVIFLFGFLNGCVNNAIYDMEANDYIDQMIKELSTPFKKIIQKGGE